MQYMLLIYANERDWDQQTPEEMGKVMAEYRTFSESIAKSGHYKAGEQLAPINTATTVRLRNGKTQVTDGPFAETREQLGGFYWVEAANLDEAIQLASRIPSARDGSIEIRPIVMMQRP
jgi:hypothetical protein